MTPQFPQVTVLHGHTSMDTAHLTDDYPYGSMRCQRREWIEHKEGRGYRLVTQTRNPKIERWNKPHAHTYVFWAFMTQDPNPGKTFGHIGWEPVSFSGVSPEQHVRLALSGALGQLDVDEAKMYRVLLRWAREKQNRSGWQRWADTVNWMAAHLDTDGQPPTRDAVNNGSRYVTEQEWTAARAQILARFDATEDLPPVPAVDGTS